MTQAIQTIERRVNELGVSEPIVAPYGSTGDQIIVQLPGVTDVARAKNIISNTALLEHQAGRRRPGAGRGVAARSLGGKVPPDMEVVPGVSGVRGDTTRLFYLVRGVPAITGRDLRNARPTIDEFEPAGGRLHAEQRGRGQVRRG